MNAVDMLKERRSIRKYKPAVIEQQVLNEIVEVARFSPSWGNLQVARYTFVSDEAKIKEISEKGVNNFTYNQSTLKNTKNLLVLSYVKGKSGKLGEGYATNKASQWEMFDTGIACQTFCLAAHEKGVGTCIFGVIDDDAIAQIIGLPSDETVAALITLGYPDGEIPSTTRKSVDEITRFV